MSADDEPDAATTRVTRKGQVTIPKELREEYGLEAGDELVWQSDEDGIKIRKATGAAGRGMLVDEGHPEETREEMAEAMERELREKRETDWEPE